MDFDDLDEEINKRVQEGEDVAPNFVENHQPVKGTVLPKMTRGQRIPDFSKLPAAKKKALPPYNGEPEVERSPVLRLLCIHGAADSYAADWCVLENEAPPNIEVVCHEFPGHGHRDLEPLCSTLDELVDDCFEAFREAMDTGAFAILAHSIGALMAIKMAKRARAELGVEPVFVIMLERGAAQHPLFTERGAQWLREEPVGFFEFWNPMIYKLYKSAPPEVGERTLSMWAKEQIMDQDAIEVGYHSFKCPMLAMGAELSWHSWVKLEDLSDENKKLMMNKHEVGAYMVEKDGKLFQGHFPEWTYKGWQDWTEHPAGCRILQCKGANHMDVKLNEDFNQELWKALKQVIETF
mmetsp:Transcript_96979/g.230677  ORF Transcript_96979/g.230677 Transcript_96979/m.230677 type:complete len:351 (+) Transcript_96979:33-1085(+)